MILPNPRLALHQIIEVRPCSRALGYFTPVNGSVDSNEFLQGSHAPKADHRSHSCWVSTVLHGIEFFTLMDGRFAGSTAKEDRSFVISASAGVIRFNPLAAAIKRGK